MKKRQGIVSEILEKIRENLREISKVIIGKMFENYWRNFSEIVYKLWKIFSNILYKFWNIQWKFHGTFGEVLEKL